VDRSFLLFCIFQFSLFTFQLRNRMKPGHFVIAVLTALAILPLLYLVSYMCLVRVETYGFGDQIRPRYLVGGEAAETFFAPIHAADEFLRPGVWREELVVYD
jgi:hypothetical protein